MSKIKEEEKTAAFLQRCVKQQVCFFIRFMWRLTHLAVVALCFSPAVFQHLLLLLDSLTRLQRHIRQLDTHCINVVSSLYPIQTLSDLYCSCFHSECDLGFVESSKAAFPSSSSEHFLVGCSVVKLPPDLLLKNQCFFMSLEFTFKKISIINNKNQTEKLPVMLRSCLVTRWISV